MFFVLGCGLPIFWVGQKKQAEPMNTKVINAGEKKPPGGFCAVKPGELIVCIGRSSDGGRIVLARSAAGNHPVRFIELERAPVLRGLVLNPRDIGVAGDELCRVRIGWLEAKAEAVPSTVSVLIDSRNPSARVCQVELQGCEVTARIVDTARHGLHPTGDVVGARSVADVIEKAERVLTRTHGKDTAADHEAAMILEAA